jgi:hypothetical protein
MQQEELQMQLRTFVESQSEPVTKSMFSRELRRLTKNPRVDSGAILLELADIFEVEKVRNTPKGRPTEVVRLRS